MKHTMPYENQVAFKQQGKQIMFEKGNEEAKCFGCHGKGVIEGKECFICHGTGTLKTKVASDFTLIIGDIAMNGRKYNIGMSYESQEIKDGQFSYKDYPIFKLKQKGNYPPQAILRIQDEVQKKIIEHFTPRSVQGENIFMCPSDTILNEVLDTLATEEAKEEVSQWFRYERTSFNNKEKRLK